MSKYSVRINDRFDGLGYTLSTHRTEDAAVKAASKERASWERHCRKHSHERSNYHSVTVHAADGSRIETREAMGV